MRRAVLTTIGIPLSVATSADAIRCDLLKRWRGQGERRQILRFVQPSLIGLIDGTISTLAPIFAAAFLAGSHAALLVGLAASLGAAISMGLSEALSDNGDLSGRGNSMTDLLRVSALVMVAGALLIGALLPARTNATRQQLETPEGAAAQVALKLTESAR